MAERFIDAGSRLDLDVRIFSYELNDEVPIREIGTVITGRRWTDADVVEHIVSSSIENEIHIVIPFVDPATILVAQVREKLPSFFIPASSIDVSKLFYNKKEAEQWFENNGIRTPVFSGSFPAIAKPVYGSASNGVRVLNSKEEADLFFLRHTESDYLLQQYIVGQEYSVDCYVDADKKILAVVPRIRIQIAGGEVIKTKTVDYPEMSDLASQILKKADLRGPVCIQFMREDISNQLYVIEVNPRFGGGVIASIEAGADMPLFLLNEYLGKKNRSVKNWQHDLLMMRAHREFFKALD
jgi:carbamoyl-phosphate synthase large subunit